jgi:hypothetical protein
MPNAAPRARQRGQAGRLAHCESAALSVRLEHCNLWQEEHLSIVDISSAPFYATLSSLRLARPVAQQQQDV